jgi:hypothetical protein
VLLLQKDTLMFRLSCERMFTSLNCILVADGSATSEGTRSSTYSGFIRTDVLSSRYRAQSCSRASSASSSATSCSHHSHPWRSRKHRSHKPWRLVFAHERGARMQSTEEGDQDDGNAQSGALPRRSRYHWKNEYRQSCDSSARFA